MVDCGCGRCENGNRRISFSNCLNRFVRPFRLSQIDRDSWSVTLSLSPPADYRNQQHRGSTFRSGIDHLVSPAAASIGKRHDSAASKSQMMKQAWRHETESLE